MSTNDSCRQQIKITLKLWKINGEVKIYHSRKKRRILYKVEADKFRKAYLKVFYGKAKTNSGKVEPIINDGTYETKEELLRVLSAFTEKSLLDDTAKWIHESQ